MPDQFGNPTPLEVRMKMQEAFQQRQKDFWNSGAAQSPGMQAGQALANIFGPSVRKYLDTRAARNDEAEALMAAHEGMTEKEAKARAKERIKPEYAEVRRAANIQESTSKLSGFNSQLLDAGYTGEEARIASMYMVANDLSDKGFFNEAQSIRKQARDEQNAEIDRLAKLDNLESSTDKNRADAFETRIETATGAQLYINVHDLAAGRTPRFSNVRKMDLETRLEYDRPDSGWAPLSPALSGQFSPEQLVNRRAMSPTEIDTLVSQFSTLNTLDIMRAAVDAGHIGLEGPLPKGWWNATVARFGYGPQEMIDLVAAEDKMAADVQSLVKGIPSNYDASVFEKMIPRAAAYKNEAAYRAKLDLLERHTKMAIEMRLAFHKGTNTEVPPEVYQAAQRYGINPAEVGAPDWAKTQEGRDKYYAAWEAEVKNDLAALEESLPAVSSGKSAEYYQGRREALLEGAPASRR